VINSGYIAINQILKYYSVKNENKEVLEHQAKDQIPVEIELGDDYVFHSIFCCPISRQMTNNENPPMMLTCGHVLSLDSIDKLGTKFKCPYCPTEVLKNKCIKLNF
jgi:hypothetical protein